MIDSELLARGVYSNVQLEDDVEAQMSRTQMMGV